MRDGLGMPPLSTLTRLRRSGERMCRADRGPRQDEVTDLPEAVAAGALPVAAGDSALAAWLVAEPNKFYDVRRQIVELKTLTAVGHRGFVSFDDGQHLLVEYVTFDNLGTSGSSTTA